MSLCVVLAILAVWISVAEAARRQKRQYYGKFVFKLLDCPHLSIKQLIAISIWKTIR